MTPTVKRKCKATTQPKHAQHIAGRADFRYSPDLACVSGKRGGGLSVGRRHRHEACTNNKFTFPSASSICI